MSKIFTTRNTTIPNLYVEMSIQNSLLVNEDCSNIIKEINGLLVNMVAVNNQLLNIQSQNSFKYVDVAELNDELNDSIKKILAVENLIDDKEKQKVLIKKKSIDDKEKQKVLIKKKSID